MSKNDITHNVDVTYICILGWWPCITNKILSLSSLPVMSVSARVRVGGTCVWQAQCVNITDAHDQCNKLGGQVLATSNTTEMNKILNLLNISTGSLI